MVDPFNITEYGMEIRKLQEHIIFWICVAGKQAKTIAPRVEGFLLEIGGKDLLPFEAIRRVSFGTLPPVLMRHGIGCYNNKARSLWALAHKGLDLKTCTADNLEEIYGIGMKTSRCFIIHSRPDAEYAGLDTHVLKFLRSKGHDAPKATPNSKRKYLELEKVFLKYAKKSGKSVAEFDLNIWRKYAVRV